MSVLRPRDYLYIRQARRATTAEIQKAVSARFDLTVDELKSDRRTRAIARPRQVAMYLSRRLTRLSFPEVGRRFGGRDHTTVIHAVRQIEKLRAVDAELDGEIAALEVSLG